MAIRADTACHMLTLSGVSADSCTRVTARVRSLVHGLNHHREKTSRPVTGSTQGSSAPFASCESCTDTPGPSVIQSCVTRVAS